MKFLFLFLFFSSNLSIFSQDTLVTYFDISWRECSKDEAHYYRKAHEQGKKLWAAHDYFMNGQLQMNGYYTSNKFKTKTGQFTYYYKNSQISYQGNYLKNNLVGEWNYWYDNGELQKRSNYSDKGLLHGSFEEWYDDGALDTQGQYNNDKMDGTWTFYFPNGQASSIETYTKGELVKVDFWESDGKKVEGDLVVWVEPEFVGGEMAMQSYIKDKLVYPKDAMAQAISGVVYVQFVINGEGSISDVRVLKPVNSLLDAEALRVVSEMPTWKPGKIHNRPVNTRYTLPINFSLAK